MNLADTVRAQQPQVLADLRDLVAIESVSADPARADQVLRSAETVAQLLRDARCPDVRVVDAGGAPAVIGRYPAPEGQPTVCLYAHHDVQPEGERAGWRTEPFVATEQGDRLFGRGAADDKGGFAVHLAALRAFDGRPPVGVTVFVEGEEEVGSPTLDRMLAQEHEALGADVFVIADSGNWDVGQPAFTTTLRGLADCVVTVSTLDHAVHSGSFGGVVPDALTSLCRLLATLHDDQGDVAVAGLATTEPPELDYPEERLRAESGLLDGVDWIGTGTVVERLWCKPALSVIALDATRVDKASNTLIPAARAKISLRVAPGDDAERALDHLEQHLLQHAPWGARVDVARGDSGEPARIPFEGPYAEAARSAFREAWSTEPVFTGQGGSIPMVAAFQEAFPGSTVLVTAISDPDSRPHGANESLHLGDFERACVAETLMLQGFADAGTGAAS
ncbi:Acetylornithine deacetylase/Succinyl-diaminopimelate desuccinylase [Microlunatus sagamiharensis]|uniref:Acetylornithine deacetylase/Succinyl-diaminopimelate desuccinylase n=1 Tax=Microlunatus sagamiharensis TaxID=546874 RepID=A0A1H2N0H6_9ACTN|nr:dipeptidase [Microlunatus sagamiharensis]SDU98930.1 Acetylornithine deacetylase/Succinyl-diaminopimelate desuccinylase [Microlunatus sagamiharensis]